MLLRHLLAIALLPFTVTILVPLWIAARYAISPRLGGSPAVLLLQAAGVAVLVVGCVLFVSSLSRFATEGKGTLAPWDPPRQLVVRGPYRFVRNPMISGVVFILAAEAMLLASRPHGLWALIVLAGNLLYIPLVEEPGLKARFGPSYAEYCRHVPRIFPSFRPWTPERTGRAGA
jgi:protein-S-isoprenylcysteine O-methyltransferase Ste14